MIGKITAIQNDKKAIFVELQQPTEFKVNDIIDCKKFHKHRSLQQNRLYFAYLQWCISSDGGDLISQGHWSVDGLHSDIKAWIQSEYPHQFDFKKIFSSAELNSKEFSDFIEIVDRELMNKFFEISTDKFWRSFNQGDKSF